MKLLNIRPKRYLEQGLRYCGGYTIKAILSAYRLDDGRHPKRYLLSLRFTTLNIIKKILENYRLKSQIKNARNLSDNDKLKLIKKELNKNHPVILLIGNGYSKHGEYSWLRKQLIAHWVSVWGYNNEDKVFYVYDSFSHKKDNVPIGNVKRNYYQLLRDWKGALYTKKYLYIVINKK